MPVGIQRGWIHFERREPCLWEENAPIKGQREVAKKGYDSCDPQQCQHQLSSSISRLWWLPWEPIQNPLFPEHGSFSQPSPHHQTKSQQIPNSGATHPISRDQKHSRSWYETHQLFFPLTQTKNRAHATGQDKRQSTEGRFISVCDKDQADRGRVVRNRPRQLMDHCFERKLASTSPITICRNLYLPRASLRNLLVNTRSIGCPLSHS